MLSRLNKLKYFCKKLVKAATPTQAIDVRYLVNRLAEIEQRKAVLSQKKSEIETEEEKLKADLLIAVTSAPCVMSDIKDAVFTVEDGKTKSARELKGDSKFL